MQTSTDSSHAHLTKNLKASVSSRLSMAWASTRDLFSLSTPTINDSGSLKLQYRRRRRAMTKSNFDAVTTKSSHTLHQSETSDVGVTVKQ